MMDTLTDMKNNLQGINNRLDEAKIKSAIGTTRKQKNTQSEQSKEKRIKKKLR